MCIRDRYRISWKGIGENMTNRTKLQLEDAFKKLLLEKPFHKITIKNLTDACYLSRMSFYYHF